MVPRAWAWGGEEEQYLEVGTMEGVWMEGSGRWHMSLGLQGAHWEMGQERKVGPMVPALSARCRT